VLPEDPMRAFFVPSFRVSTGFKRTPFEHARLVIGEVPVVVFCSKCQAERPVHSVQWFCCVECGAPASVVVHGRELQLAALEFVE
jgi:hydrogenase nickel incorporation protein HypA/HybF